MNRISIICRDAHGRTRVIFAKATNWVPLDVADVGHPFTPCTLDRVTIQSDAYQFVYDPEPAPMIDPKTWWQMATGTHDV